SCLLQFMQRFLPMLRNRLRFRGNYHQWSGERPWQMKQPGEQEQNVPSSTLRFSAGVFGMRPYFQGTAPMLLHAMKNENRAQAGMPVPLFLRNHPYAIAHHEA
ncbi:MAG: hypothetical protein RMM98_14635, partial [Acidobacteriota bacterium]|nr:hypothetical protein [Acidobacteriota bacterium]